MAQVVVTNCEARLQVDALTHETVVEVLGTVALNAEAPGGFELAQPVITVISPTAEDPPIELYKPDITAQLPTRLDLAPLALRHPVTRARFHVSASALAGFRSSLSKRRFVEICTPKIVESATEGGASVFRIDYFGRPAYLAQSPQFYKQIMAGVFERVFEVAPVFRAEPHDTRRHLNEYVSLDAEMAFIEGPATVMNVLRDVIADIWETIQDTASESLKLPGVTLPTVPHVIPLLHFTEAQRMISASTGEDLAEQNDLSPSHELWLGQWANNEHDSDFVFVLGYPSSKRPFYTHSDPGRPEFSLGFDLLFVPSNW